MSRFDVRGKGRRRLAGLAFAAVLFFSAVRHVSQARRSEFRLREVPVFGLETEDRRISQRLVRSRPALCRVQRDMDISVCPELESDRSLYGELRLRQLPSQPQSGVGFRFILDESNGPGSGYDRLYFDLNRDLDLANDGVVKPMEDPPASLDIYSGRYTTVVFETLTMDMDYEPQLGRRPIDLVPSLVLTRDGGGSVAFVAATARKGTARLGRGWFFKRKYDVILAQPYYITGRLDHARTALYLIPKGTDGRRPTWLGAEELRAMHWIDGTLLRFSATPTGDRLRVRPYRGDFGLFEVGSGGRDVKELNMCGSVESRDAAIAVGKLEGGRDWPTEARAHDIPVGDYLPTYLVVRMGPLSITLSQNYHSDGHPMDRRGRPDVYGIKIRKGRPFILDFSNEPEVMFVSPARDHCFRRGDTIKVKALLTDPALDIMIRGLTDTSRKEEFVQDGRKYERLLSLTPKVVIATADGKPVAEGVMPFG